MLYPSVRPKWSSLSSLIASRFARQSIGRMTRHEILSEGLREMVACGGEATTPPARNARRDYAMSRPAFLDRDVSQFGWSAVSPSRPTLSQSAARNGRQGKRAAARSHAQPPFCGEHGEHGEHWTLMAVACGATLAQAGCVRTSASRPPSTELGKRKRKSHQNT